MIKFVTLLHRRNDLSPEEFHRYWREVHAPLVLQLPGVIRYVQSRVVELSDRDSLFDGMAELWYEDAESLKGAIRSPEYEVLLADEENFMGAKTQESITLVLTEDEIPAND